MLLNPKLIKNKFEKCLDKYNDYAKVQNITAEKLLDAVFAINNEYENILELGCGSGLLTQKIANKLGYKNYYANDLTEKTKNYIRKIIPNASFYIGNAVKIKPDKKFDLIISNAMFQWIDLYKAESHFLTILNNTGILAFSTFTQGNYEEIKNITGLTLEYKSQDEIIKIFSKNYKLLWSENFEYTLKFDNPLELLAHMKFTGVNSINNKSWNFKQVKEFCSSYIQKYSDITLTYKPLIFIFEKK